ERLQPLLAELRVDLLEQPLPAGEDAALEGFAPLVPIAADESAHIAGDVAALAGKYQVVNIKLDKTGGLTGALALAEAAAA
ncbi:dipeptide epimerase, partial [Escherichia coli]|nr:dipeptide epimerase [Escherichia coli]